MNNKILIRQKIFQYYVLSNSAGEIHEYLKNEFKSGVPTLRTVFRWLSYFKNGRKNVKDEYRSGHPITHTHINNCHTIKKMIQQNPYISLNQILKKINIGKGSAFKIIKYKTIILVILLKIYL
jgi:hypothetical protein